MTVRLALLVVAVVASSATGAAAGPGPVTYSSPVWSPNGKRIAFVSDLDPKSANADIYVAAADGTNVRRITNEPRGKTGLAWSPNGKWIAYQSYAYIEEVSPDGKRHRRLTPYGGSQPAFSRSGRRIAYANGAGEFYAAIYAMRPDGSKKTLVARPSEGESLTQPTWSPDGERLAFSVGTAADTNLIKPYLAVISQYRGRRTKYIPGHLSLSTDWSPDGRRILLVQSTRKGDGYFDFKVSVLDLRTRKLRDLGQTASYTARWSPDGRRILFENGGAIYVMNADGSHVRKLLP
jgi:Tol biopolymer transport system component